MARKLSLSEQIERAEALWNATAQRNPCRQPTAAQAAELDRRIADLDANPDEVTAWSEVKAEALSHIGR